jgi:hypothetical protein
MWAQADVLSTLRVFHSYDVFATVVTAADEVARAPLLLGDRLVVRAAADRDQKLRSKRLPTYLFLLVARRASNRAYVAFV